MVQIFWIMNIFDKEQTLEVRYNYDDANPQIFRIDYNELIDKIVELASTAENSKIYLSGLPENNLFTLKEEIINQSQIKYSNNNIEVILV